MFLGIAFLISMTLAALTFNSRAVARIPRPSSNARRMRSTLMGGIRGRPRRLPDDRARSNPASTRSRIMARSNSLNTDSMFSDNQYGSALPRLKCCQGPTRCLI
jgi:hypothetical protein